MNLTQSKNKIKGYINIANKAGYLVIGADKLKNYNKKLYLLMADKTAGKNLFKIARAKQDIPFVVLNNLCEYVGIENCKIIGIKNFGLSQEILKIVKEQNIE